VGKTAQAISGPGELRSQIHVDEPILAAAGPPEGSTADLGQAHADVDDSRSKVWRNKAHINRFE
jgi:hypothetical protein